MSAGEGNVAAYRAAHQGQDGAEQRRNTGFGNEGIFQGIANRRLHHKNNHQDHNDHNAAHDLGSSIHSSLGVLYHEDQDCQGTGQNIAHFRGDSQQSIEAQGTAADVADVEHQAAQHDHKGNKVAQARQQLIGHILTAKSGHAQHTPDVDLSNGGHDDGHQDDKTEAGTVLTGEGSRLGQKSRADCRSRHQERSTQQCTAAFFRFTHKILSFSGYSSMVPATFLWGNLQPSEPPLAQ